MRAAVEWGGPVIPVYIWAPEEERDWPPGAASRWWLHYSLDLLGHQIQERGSRLLLLRGPTLDALRRLARDTGADAVYWNRRYEPDAIERDTKVKASLRESGLTVRSFNASLLFEPWEIQTKSGGPYKVFTPFWKACLRQAKPPAPLAAPKRLSQPPMKTRLEEVLSAWRLDRNIEATGTFKRTWKPGTKTARQVLTRFLNGTVAEYPSIRDRPDLDGTSRLSPYLHFGEISPRHIWHEAHNHLAVQHEESWPTGMEAFLRQLVWREFAYHLLFHFPETVTNPLRPEFQYFPWKRNTRTLQAWQDGLTGYPLVDAGMRELRDTGTMHNRVRMVAASFLVKDLLIPWQEGAAWFWDRLIDADLANNTLGWQWTAGCGADAAPFFRIFNPMTQGDKFDPDGSYTRRWVPEIAGLPNRWLQKPWEASQSVRREAGVELGRTYPMPIVNHADARDRALNAYKGMKGGMSSR